MDKISVLIGKEKIEKRIAELGEEINKDLNGEETVVIVLLKGAFVFASDIVRKINAPIEIDFAKLSSYGNGTASTGKINVEMDFSADIKGKNVLIIEDIIDTGATLSYFANQLKRDEPKAVKICVLLDKKERRREQIEADYIGFEIPDDFVVGYGLDYAQKYRNLPYIGKVENI